MSTFYTEREWSELTHAYGSAEDVPALLAQLNSPDEQAREAACSELFGNIWHQGTVYPATVKALPHLIALFRSPDCIDRNLVAILLASIADGDGYYHVHSRLESLRDSFEKSLAGRGSSIAKEIEKESDYLKVIREMSLEVLPLLEPFLDSPDWCTREAVVGALRRYAGHIPHICSRLQERLSVETHENVRHRIEEALAEIGQAHSAAPNGGPATRSTSSGAAEGPPSAS